MKNFKKITSAFMSAIIGLSGVVPMISNAEDAEPTTTQPVESASSETLLPTDLPCSIDGNTVTFFGDKDFDFVVSASPYSEFKADRTINSFKFTPEKNGGFKQDGSFLVSRIWMNEGIMNFDNDQYGSHAHYFYPVIQNFEVTYNSKLGVEVELIGKRSFLNEDTVKELQSVQSADAMACFDRVEMNTDDILNSGSYYTLASCTLGSPTFFTYYDYGYESDTRKDKSLFCFQHRYIGYGEDDRGISVTGNAEVTNTFHGGSSIDGNLEIATCDEVLYTIIEPTGDGLAEVYCNPYHYCDDIDDLYMPDYDVDFFPSSLILTIENGQFLTSAWTMGCVLPESGDLNMDGYINIADAVTFQKYMLGTTKLTNTQLNTADLNWDYSVDIFDMVLLRKAIIEDRITRIPLDDYNHEDLIPEPIDTIR